MSSFIVKISNIQSVDALHIVNFNLFDITLSMMSLDLPSNIQIGSEVTISIKPTNVAIGKNLNKETISYSNQLTCVIDSIDYGELLCSIKLIVENIIIESIITLHSAKRMNLKIGDRVEAIFKASDLSISESK